MEVCRRAGVKPWNTRRLKSSHAVEMDAEEKQRKYLQTWLGQDMAGERYLTQLVTAATAQQKQKQQMQQQHQQQLQEQQQGRGAATMATSAAVSNQYLNVPVISIRWAGPIESIQSDLASALEAMGVNDACFLDFSGISAEASADKTLEAVVEALTKGAKTMQLLGAVNCVDAGALKLARGAGLVHVALRMRGVAATGGVKAADAAPVVALSSSSSALSSSSSSSSKASATAAAAVAAPHAPSARIHYGAVRSGQQIYAEGCSLIVIGSVNDGAEVLADGDIHVYGSLKGRAVAGLGGLAPTASVFAHVFDASLVGIADAFVMPDDCPSLRDVIGKAVRIRMARQDSGEEGTSVDCGNGNNLLFSILHLKDV